MGYPLYIWLDCFVSRLLDLLSSSLDIIDPDHICLLADNMLNINDLILGFTPVGFSMCLTNLSKSLNLSKFLHNVLIIFIIFTYLKPQVFTFINHWKISLIFFSFNIFIVYDLMAYIHDHRFLYIKHYTSIYHSGCETFISLINYEINVNKPHDWLMSFDKCLNW
jgi:hypothetical protein